MNKNVYKALRATAMTLCALTALAAAPTFAQCDPALKAAAEAQSQKDLEEELKNIEDAYKGHLTQPDWLKNSDGLLTACSNNNWAVPSFGSGSFGPLLTSLLSKAKERVVKEACNQARSAISQASTSYKDVLKSVPGYENIATANSTLTNWQQTGSINLPSSSSIPAGSGLNWGDLGLPPAVQIPGVSPPRSGSSGSIPGITP